MSTFEIVLCVLVGLGVIALWLRMIYLEICSFYEE